MHVLMLGWEFPPFIAGGLGTACHGLTKALDRLGVEVTFVLPKAIDRSESSHVNLLSPSTGEPSRTPSVASLARQGRSAERGDVLLGHPGDKPFEHVQFIGVPAEFASPYQKVASEGPVGRWVIRKGVQMMLAPTEVPQPGDVEIQAPDGGASSADTAATHGAPMAAWETQPAASAPVLGEEYGGDLLEQVARFSRFCVAAARNVKFDVIHAHDWMTYPAGLDIARMTGKPLVVHVHSTEFDRSGIHVNQRIYDIERRGMHGAMRVIAVSQLTKNVIVSRYGVPEGKVEVVYNGVDLQPTQGEHMPGIQSKDKIVLYFGRITYQKGPEYFIQAAKRVLEVMPDVKFVVAGSGDQAARMIEMAAHLGIGHKVLFTGFLRGKDIKRVFALADLYVMPSVSEPFGIAPLEAMAHDVPALISKSSGVSEVLTHALKCDFWDIDDMANKIVAVLRHPPLSKTLKEHGAFEVRKITWEGAASRCQQIYRSAIEHMHNRAAAPA